MPSPKTARKSPRPSDRHCLSAQLREIVASRDLSAYAVAKLAGIDAGVLGRFMNGERDIRMGTADKIAGALGLRLVEVAKGKARARAPRAVEGPGSEASPDREGPGMAPGASG